ncbi:MAG: hypothetical protein J6V80_01330 [Clostridia bacterium]|nr:hypothetical protein [Clostridia bacterium]
MKKIKIFLASSITELKNERRELELFIRNVSDHFEEKYNVKLQPWLCENIDEIYTKRRKQDEFNDLIRSSDFCFFIFFTKVGKYTREEFDIARKQFEETNKPKIYTYFKNIEDGESVDQEIFTFMEELSEVFGHYYSTFSHIETIKLRLLLSLTLEHLDFVKISVNDGKCLVNNHPVMSLDNVAEFANNQHLSALMQELQDVEKEYYELRCQLDKKIADAEFHNRYIGVSSRRKLLLDEIDDLQKKIFTISLQMVKDEIHGVISDRQRRAYELFEKGKYEDCLSILNSEDIDNDFFKARARIKEQEVAVCRKYIKEHKTAIDIINTITNCDEKWRRNEIEKRYRKIVPVVFEMGIELNVANECGLFYEELIEHSEEPRVSNYVKALNYYKKVLDIREALPIDKDNSILDLAKSHSLIENILRILGQHDARRFIQKEALELCEKTLEQHESRIFHLKKSIELCEIAENENGEEFDFDLVYQSATNYASAAFYYEDYEIIPQLEEYYYKKLDDLLSKHEVALLDSKFEYNENLLSSFLIRYRCLSSYYQNHNNQERALELLWKEVNICNAYFEKNKTKYGTLLASAYSSLSTFYHRANQYDKCELCYLKEIEIMEELLKEDPDNNIYVLSYCYTTITQFYCYRMNTPEKAETYCLRDLSLYQELVTKKPEKYLPTLIKKYTNLCQLYLKIDRFQDAERYLIDSIKLCRALDKIVYADNIHIVLGVYENAREVYTKLNQPEKAEYYESQRSSIFEHWQKSKLSSMSLDMLLSDLLDDTDD